MALDGFMGGLDLRSQQQQAPAVQLVQPFNDIQLLALVSAHMSSELPPKEAVERAVELVLESIRHEASLLAKCQELRNELKNQAAIKT